MSNHDFLRAAAIALDAVMRVPKKAPLKSKPSKPEFSSSNETVIVQDEDLLVLTSSRPVTTMAEIAISA
ncbi:hypothetical protein O9X99_24535 [Agrobacterium salinitolerans]|uniref:Uncharacterized protein n=1 Tax=Agrobacterium salinitolerans TaxID=1183413 RepID=A0A9X3KTM3_9HYPH|nr:MULTISPECIES: hypothetical protein [Agrobacterium]MCZ7853826.1 hypothetical protein [Agrobacterium salinitolerans]MCZ7894831.1 hypothetical protein [Agrobacterium salinitolerans]MCZ7940757.1 hypothetical protein [Agrobacterium salinitolerans]TRA82863.1 hypothetical protein EXN23_25810 [Agrobacterium salinitolerans]